MAKKKQESYTNKKAVIYARYSSHAQNDASIEQQIEKCTAYANKHGLEVIATYADRAMTGKNDHRPDFQRMLKDSETGKFQIVIAWKSNRMGRNMMEAMINDARLQDNDVKTRYVEEDFDDSAAGRFSLRNMMNLNQFYSENMAEDIYRGLEDAAKNGRVIGKIPFGYKSDPITKKYVFDEMTAPIVREIFERFNLGESLALLIDDLNARGIKTQMGGRWNKNSFHRLLTNERYMGTYKWGNVIIPNGIPQIIDEETFEKAQDRLKGRTAVAGRRRGDVDFLLTGKLFCGHCGEMMVGNSGTGTGGTYYYYVCRGQREMKACAKKAVRKDVIEKAVARGLMDNILSRDDILEKMADTILAFQEKLKENSELAYMNAKLAECRHAMSNLMKALETGVVSETITSRIHELENEAKDYASRISEWQRKVPNYTRDMILFYLEQFRGGNVDDPKVMKKLFNQFIDEIILYDDRMTITFGYTGDEGLEIEIDGTEVDIDISLDNGTEEVRLDSPKRHQRCQKRTNLSFDGKKFALTLPFEA